jgi:hypothetical protein
MIKQRQIMNPNITVENGRYTAVINGKKVYRTKLEHMEYVLRKAGAPSVAECKPTQSKFTINQRFGFLTDMVTMLAKGDQASVVVTGPGGLGKSHTVTKALTTFGLKDMSVLDDFEIGAEVPKNAFVTIKGYSTPKGLYRTLYENRKSTIIFDDCDSVLKDAVSLNLLKGALDSYSKRIISWRADMKDDELPQSFEFKGRVVFISNLSSSSLDQAILTRSMVVDLSMTTEQKVERMRHIAFEADFMPDFDKQFKTDALDLIASIRDEVKELSLRTLIQVVKIRKSNPNNNWKDLATYAIAG